MFRRIFTPSASGNPVDSKYSLLNFLRSFAPRNFVSEEKPLLGEYPSKRSYMEDSSGEKFSSTPFTGRSVEYYENEDEISSFASAVCDPKAKLINFYITSYSHRVIDIDRTILCRHIKTEIGHARQSKKTQTPLTIEEIEQCVAHVFSAGRKPWLLN